MIPGKQYKPEDFLKIVWRRRWIVVLPLLVGAVGAFLYSRTLPDRFRSEALVLVIPPQVPANYVRPTVNSPLKDRLEVMRRQILSRARLEQIIEELNLYREERRVMLMDQVVERMRDDVNLKIPKTRRREDPNNFVVSFDADDAQSAVAVTERVASLFVRENMEGRSVQTDATIQFLQSQVDDSLRQLRDYEKRLEVFKQSHSGQLPSQLETNLQLMESARHEIQAMADGINRDRDRRLTVERTIEEELSFASAAVSKGNASQPAQQGGAARGSAAQQLATARTELEALRLRFKEDHPDIKIALNRIKDLEKKAEAEALQQPVSESGPAAAQTPGELERQKRLARLRGELEDIDREIQAKQARMQRAQNSLTENERRVQAAPGVGAQIDDLMRNYGSVKNTYDTLLKKLQDAKLASNVEQRQVGEQFRIIDPARRPDRPYAPNRVRMNIIGAVMGLGLGLAIAGLLEYRDTSLRTEEDVIVALALPVLAIVPTMRTIGDARRRQRRRRLLLIGSGAAGMIVLSVMAVAWKFRLFERWGL